VDDHVQEHLAVVHCFLKAISLLFIYLYCKLLSLNSPVEQTIVGRGQVTLCQLVKLLTLGLYDTLRNHSLQLLVS